MLFLHALQVCILLTGIVTVNSYVLFSANLDDFHKLAQKFVPDNLAMKLTELVSESSIDKRHDRDGRGQRKTTTDKKDVNDYERNKEQENSNIGREESNNGKQMMQYFPVEISHLNIKSKLRTKQTREQPNLSAERDVSDRISPTTRKRPTWSEQKNVYDGSPETRRPSIFSIQRERTEKPITTTQETFPDYIEREWMTTERKKSPTENEWMATDRYTTEKEKKTEDYVLEDKRNDKLQPFDNVPVYEKDPIQARTESLLFNSKELEDQSNNTRYTMKGTGIPTREYYKMSTPDYYKKLPRIVEKYDFNEPIPEADREREKIDDRFAQEPARVNHKVRQQREKTGRSEKQPRQKDSTIQKRNQDKAGPIETILENIGFHFKAIADVTEYANA
ncbi:hypothetical protein MSG28_005432 [Choristoneura fumiferana]|uniref:Uncharacterized protein n=1 Tax=Choristoneura fumiferana TaxID=7141 RepID=A0ACC0KZI2_CHOFU|nr:hypothetical protein MSG28_005432 [Choristoneura fumiferana]